MILKIHARHDWLCQIYRYFYHHLTREQRLISLVAVTYFLFAFVNFFINPLM